MIVIGDNEMHNTVMLLSLAMYAITFAPRAGADDRQDKIDTASAIAADAAPVIEVPSIPAGECRCEDYRLTVAGRDVPVYVCRVSAVPLNQVWPGYQRPLDQTETAGFAYWDMRGPAEIVVRCRQPVRTAVLRPGRLGVQPAIQGDCVRFTLDRPRPVVVEVNGPHRACTCLPPSPGRMFPRPIRQACATSARAYTVRARSRSRATRASTLPPAPSSLAAFRPKKPRTSASTGGASWTSAPSRGEGGGAVRLTDCSHAVVEGIVMRDPDVWCCSLFGCRNVTIQGVKLIGLWRYNADGINVCNSQDVVVRDCFVRSFDDSFVVKGLKFARIPFTTARSATCDSPAA